MHDLDPIERDMLLEAASITAGKTIRAVSNIIGQNVTISPPQLLVTSIDHVADSMGKPQDIKTTVLVRILGETHGAVVLLIDPNDVGELLTNVEERLRLSALEEITNIVAGTALGSLSKLLHITFLQSVPASATDMLRAVMSEIAIDLSRSTEEILCLRTSLSIGPRRVPASLYLLFDADTTTAILNSGKHLIEKQSSS